MMQKILAWWKQLKCNHLNSDLNRWHLVHYPEHEPLAIEAEYICKDCGEVSYLYFRGREKTEWEKCMGDYKKH